MTVIHGIEIDDFEYKPNNIKKAIRTLNPIENKLHVIAVISNPCNYARRCILMSEFKERMMRDEPDVILYVVELVYGKQRFHMTQSDNPRHLQLRTETPLWHKENMINMAVKKMLPADWKAMAWIDADLEFESTTWAKDTLRILNGECDIVQLFSHCIDMNHQEYAMNIFSSAGFQYSKRLPYTHYAGGRQNNFWHPGYAWACTHTAYETMGGLFDKGILGSGDNIILLCLLQNGHKAIHVDSTDGYKQSVLEFQERVKELRLGYVPGVIRHYFHGTKANRKYSERWNILLRHEYDPYLHVIYHSSGILVPTPMCPDGLKKDILHYFSERNEDDGLGSDGKYFCKETENISTNIVDSNRSDSS